MGLIHVIRHARPARTGLFLGRLDEPLVPQHLEPSTLDAAIVYSSPLLRARDTAAMLFPSAEIVVLDDLAEYSFGEWEGLSWNEISLRWPEMAAEKMSDWRRLAPPNGEAWPEFEARVCRAFRRIREGPCPAAVVGHGGVNSVLAACISGADPFTFRQDYCEVITLELRD